MKHIMMALCVLLTATPAMAEDACKLTPIATLPLTVRDNQPSVPISLAGRPLQMVVDTGGAFSMLTPKTVQTLGLDTHTVGAYQIKGLGDVRINHYVDAPNLVVGGLSIATYKFLVMPDDGEKLDGVLAPEILAAFDDDFDFAGGKLNLFSPDHCAGRVAYWTSGDVARLPFTLDEVHHLKMTVQVDGKDVRVDVDTGATKTVLSMVTAERLFGITAADPNLKSVGLVNNRVQGWLYPFKALAVGGVTVRNPQIVLVATDSETMNVLGMDVLSKLHLYISYKEKALYVTDAAAH